MHALRYCLAVVLLPSAVLALDSSRAVTQYVHRSWGIQDGLPQASAAGIAQTPDGFLWIGTQHGLARFDGVRFTVYEHAGVPELPDDNISALHTDSGGTLWIGTPHGVTTWRAGVFRTLRGPNAPSGPVFAIYEAHDGAIWIASRGAVWAGKGDSFVRRQLPIPGDVLSIAEQDGSVWLAAYGGLFRVQAGDRAAMEHFTTADGLPDNNVLSLDAFGGDLWIGTMRGVAVRHGGKLDRAVPNDLRTEETWTILHDRGGTLWFGTRHGLVRLAGGATATYRSTPAADYIIALLEDREGSLWAGTQLAGIQQFRDGALTTFTTAEGLGSNVVWSSYPDSAGNVWFGTDGGGLARLTAGRLSRIPDRDGHVDKTITALARDNEGTLWVGTWDRGLFSLRDGRWSVIAKKDGLADDLVASITVDGPVVWVGTAHGLSRIERGQIRNFGTREGLPSDYIVQTHRDRKGRMWVATDGGPCILEGDRCAARVGASPLPHHTAYFLHDTADGGLLIGTHEGLLSVSPRNVLRLLTTRDGLLQNEVWQMEEDRAGDYWLSSTKGIYRLRRGDLGRGRVDAPLLLDSSDGMKGGEVTLGVTPASSAGADGALWFSTTEGAVRLDPSAIGRPGTTPVPILEGLDVDGVPLSPVEGLRIRPGAEKLAFRFTAPSFAAPERLHFRYRLDGYDKDWVDAGTQRAAYYTHLPPGGYHFRMMVDDGYGRWSASGAALSLLLQPRFTQTIWFYLLVALAALSAMQAVNLARMRSTRARHAAVLAERTRIAREFHDTLAQDLASLSYHLDAVSEIEETSRRKQAINEAKDLTRHCLAEARRSLLDLRPETLERDGLAPALAEMAERAAQQSGTAVHARFDGVPRPLDPRVEQHVLRIAQEAVANAVRHSGAHDVDLVARYRPDRLTLAVSGRNGGGTPAGRGESTRVGLLGLQERAAEIGAELTVIGERRGLTVELSVPIPRRGAVA